MIISRYECWYFMLSTYQHGNNKYQYFLIKNIYFCIVRCFLFEDVLLIILVCRERLILILVRNPNTQIPNWKMLYDPETFQTLADRKK